ncbi:MAG: ABC transporter permease [Propionivibrio sp.]
MAPYIFLAFVVLSHIVLKYTRFGRDIFATGGNATVAQMAGINVVFYKFIIFIILGVLTAVAGMVMASRLNSGNSLFGNDLALSVVAAVVIGGTSLSGGKGNVLKTLLGMPVIGVLFNALLILGVQANWQDVIKGSILIAVVAFDAYFSKVK